MVKKKEEKEKGEEENVENRKEGGKGRKKGKYPCVFETEKTLQKIKYPKNSKTTNILKGMAAKPKIFFK